MSLDPEVVWKAAHAVLVYRMAGKPEDRDEAHARLSDLLLLAQRQGDAEAEAQARLARNAFEQGAYVAAEQMVEKLGSN